jgi:CubicO group peptidase (beta-lactamase class C family)
MRNVLGAYVDRGQLPGIVTLVSRRGEVHVDCIGYERDTIFRMASMTKPVTAVAAMILVEDGVLRLDDPVAGILPELAEPRVLRAIDAPLDDTVPLSRAITLRDILTFTFGTGFVIADPGTYPIQIALEKAGFAAGLGATVPAGEFVQRLATIPLVHQPGEVWMYHTGYDLLGILIQRAAGCSFGEFLHERIFEPLGMKDSGFTVAAGSLDRLPTAYVPDDGGGLKVEDPSGTDSEFSRPRELESGGGGLVSTIDDWFAFVSMLLNHGSVGSTRILSRPAVETMTTDHLTAEQKARTPWQPGWFDTHGWGFGVGMVTRRYDIASTPGKYGWEGGYGTSWYNDPREEMVTIAMTQVGMWPHNVVRDFWTLAYAALE